MAPLGIFGGGAPGQPITFAITQMPKLTGDIISLSILVALAWITTILRFWTRAALVKNLAWDDAFMAFTMVYMPILNY